MFAKILHDGEKMKIISQKLPNVRVMALPVVAFVNDCKTALNGNQISKLFEVTPPTLNEYVAGLYSTA